MRKGIALIVLLLLPLLASATIISVPGDYVTIQAAVNESSDGDTVMVAPGTYQENVNFNGHHILLASHYILTEDEDDINNTIIDGSNNGICINISNLGATDAAVIGFTIQNGFGLGSWPNVVGAGINIEDSSVDIGHCVFLDCEASGSSSRGAGILYESYNQPGGTIEYCTFQNMTAYFGQAIAIMNDTYSVLIQYCEAYETTSTAPDEINQGAFYPSYSDDITFYRCIAHHNQSAGFRIWGSTNVVIDHCTSADNSTYGILALYTGNDLFVTNTIAMGGPGYDGIWQGGYNNALSCTYSDIGNGTGNPWFGEGCFDEDPMFEDPDNYDYHLADGSPCIDAGDPDSPWDPDNTLPDVGALYGQGEPPLAMLTLFPQNAPVIVPAEGGTVLFDAEILSNLQQAVQAQGWLSITLPNSQVVQPINLVNVIVPVGTTNIYNLSFDVPGLAPEGTYIVSGRIGNYPNFIGIEDSFTFEKQGIRPGPFDDWFGSGWEQLSPQVEIAGDMAGQTLPAEYSMAPVYPNPFNAAATVSVSLPEAGELTLTVFNAAGQQALTLSEGQVAAGMHSFTLEMSQFASGLYFVRATVPGNLNEVRKAMLVR